MKRYYLALEKGLLQQRIYPLEGEVTIGRSPDNSITIADPTVSRAHARLSLQEGSWMVEDLGSANGVIIAGRRVSKKALSPGESFQIGTASFRLIEEDTAEDAGQFSQTLEAFAATLKYESAVLAPRPARAESKRLQEALLSVPLFESLGPAERRKLADAANLQVFNAGELIIREGDPGRSLYIILDGRVRVLSPDHKGRNFQLAILGPNQFFGEMSLLTGEPRSSSVVALEETLLSELSYASMRRLILHYPAVKGVLLKYYHDRLKDSRQKRAKAGIKERRRHPRLRERLPVSFVLSATATLPAGLTSSTYQATSENISLSGILLRVEEPALQALSPGYQLRLEIVLPAPWGRLRTLGTIRRVFAGARETRLGIEFLGTSAREQKKLRAFIYGEVHVGD